MKKIITVLIAISCVITSGFFLTRYNGVKATLDYQEQVLKEKKEEAYNKNVKLETIDVEGVNVVSNGNLFNVENAIIENENGKLCITKLQIKEYSSNSDIVYLVNGYVELTSNEEAGYIDSEELKGYIKGDKDLQVKAVTKDLDISKNYADKTYITKTSSQNISIFNHKISEAWSKDYTILNNEIHLRNENKDIYIYYLNDEIYMGKDLLETNAIIARTNEEVSGYKVYILTDQLKTYEVLAKTDADVLEAFARKA